MATWAVTVPIVGKAYAEVEAETEQEAIQKAIETIQSEHLEGWEPVEHVTNGNICYAPQNSAAARQID